MILICVILIRASFIEENATETKFLVGDNYGQLSLLVIPHSGEMDFELLGKVHDQWFYHSISATD